VIELFQVEILICCFRS